MYRLRADGKHETSNTRLAAACVTLGIPVSTHRKIHEGTEEEQKTFILDDFSVLTDRKIETASLLWKYNDGSLEKADPCHPLLDALRGLANRAALIRWIKNREPQCLAIHPNQVCPRTTYVRGEPIIPPANIETASSIETYPTADLAIASALGVCGIPVSKLSGSSQQTIFHLAARGFPLHLAPPQQAAGIVTDFEAGRLDPNHPFHWAHAAVLNYRVLLDTMSREMPMIFFEDSKNSGRAALIRADSKRVAFDKANRWFRSPIRN